MLSPLKVLIPILCSTYLEGVCNQKLIDNCIHACKKTMMIAIKIYHNFQYCYEKEQNPLHIDSKRRNHGQF